MKMTTLVKASMFAATLGFISMLAPAARAQADAMPNPDEFPFEAPQATAAQPVQIAAAQVANADFEGKVSLPFNVKCGATNLKAGQYLLSVKSQGSSRVVTLRSAGQNMTMRVHEVSAHRGANQSALLVRKSGEGRRLEGAPLGALVEERDDAFDLGNGFDADPVSGQQQQAVRGHSRCLDLAWRATVLAAGQAHRKRGALSL